MAMGRTRGFQPVGPAGYGSRKNFSSEVREGATIFKEKIISALRLFIINNEMQGASSLLIRHQKVRKLTPRGQRPHPVSSESPGSGAS